MPVTGEVKGRDLLNAVAHSTCLVSRKRICLVRMTMIK